MKQRFKEWLRGVVRNIIMFGAEEYIRGFILNNNTITGELKITIPTNKLVLNGVELSGFDVIILKRGNQEKTEIKNEESAITTERTIN